MVTIVRKRSKMTKEELAFRIATDKRNVEAKKKLRKEILEHNRKVIGGYLVASLNNVRTIEMFKDDAIEQEKEYQESVITYNKKKALQGRCEAAFNNHGITIERSQTSMDRKGSVYMQTATPTETDSILVNTNYHESSKWSSGDMSSSTTYTYLVFSKPVSQEIKDKAVEAYKSGMMDTIYSPSRYSNLGDDISRIKPSTLPTLKDAIKAGRLELKHQGVIHLDLTAEELNDNKSSLSGMDFIIFGCGSLIELHKREVKECTINIWFKDIFYIK